MLYSNETKPLENRCRRAAVRQRYRLVRNAARDPLSIGFGHYSLVCDTSRNPRFDPRRGQVNGRHELIVLENVPLTAVIEQLHLPMQS